MMAVPESGNNEEVVRSEHLMRWTTPAALASFGLVCVGLAMPGRAAEVPATARVACGKAPKSRDMAASAPFSVVGRGLAPEVVMAVVRESFGRFRHCYEQALRDCPRLQDRVVVEFVIRPDGTVAKAKDGGSDMVDKSVIQCVVKAFESLRFPSFDGPPIRVVYPVVFEPGR